MRGHPDIEYTTPDGLHVRQWIGRPCPGERCPVCGWVNGPESMRCEHASAERGDRMAIGDLTAEEQVRSAIVLALAALREESPQSELVLLAAAELREALKRMDEA